MIEYIPFSDKMPEEGKKIVFSFSDELHHETLAIYEGEDRIKVQEACGWIGLTFGDFSPTELKKFKWRSVQ